MPAQEPEPLWLLMLADLLSLLLCFFVMLYAMHEPQAPKADGKTPGQTMEDPVPDAGYDRQDQWLESGQLGYQYKILRELLAKSAAPAPRISMKDEQIIVHLSSDVFFAPGSAEIAPERQGQLANLLEAIGRTGLAMSIVGHTDPQAITGASAHASNWGLSLARAMEVERLANGFGLGGNHKILGAAAGEFGEISQDLGLTNRYNMARRVDLILTQP